MVKLLLFRFRVTNLRLKNKKFHFELLTRWVHFYFLTFELRRWKLINEKNSFNITVWMSVNPQRSILLLRFLRTSYNSMPWGFPAMLKSRSGIDMVSRDGDLSYLCLLATFLLVPETFKFKIFEAWLPATCNNGRVIKY